MIGDSIRNLFKTKISETPTPPSKESAWSEDSSIYAQTDFEKYNPDGLIGRKGFGIYRKMMMDEQVKAAVKFKRDAITSRDYYFELDADKVGISQEEAERRIELCENIIEQTEGSFSDILNNIMSAVYNGFSLNEKLFKLIQYDGRQYWGLSKLKLKPFDTFRFVVDDYGNILKLVQKISNREQTLDMSKFIHFVYNPDVDEHYGQSELREAYRAWFSKDKIIMFRNIWLERHAGGFRWAQVKEGQTLIPGSAEYAALQQVLASTQTATSAIFPSSVDYKTDYPENNVAFKEAIQDCDLSISRALLIPNLMGITPSGQTGSYSQSDTQLEAFMWTLDADTARLEDALNEQLFKELNKANFGDDAVPVFRFKPSSEKKKMEIINAWKDLVTAGAVQHTDTDDARLRELLNFPKPGDPIEQPVAPPSPDANQEDDPKKPVKEEEKKTPDSSKEETILGKGMVTVTAFDKAVKRVDFAVIGKKTDDSADEHVDVIGSITGELLRIVTENLQMDGIDIESVNKLRFDSGTTAKLRRKINSMLKEGWNIGAEHAETEISKAKKEQFTAQPDRLNMISAKYFDVKSFTITGKLTSDMLASVKNIILNGAKGGQTTGEVVNAIYKDAATKGVLSMEEAKAALGAALNVANPDARLNTIVRTNTFEAINEARYAYFTDPGLDGFVEALEYSSILDTRTTQICQHLDGHIHAANSPVWDQYRPPNHYNCRSLLIPVTQLDKWSESDTPTIDPQQGF